MTIAPGSLKGWFAVLATAALPAACAIGPGSTTVDLASGSATGEADEAAANAAPAADAEIGPADAGRARAVELRDAGDVALRATALVELPRPGAPPPADSPPPAAPPPAAPPPAAPPPADSPPPAAPPPAAPPPQFGCGAPAAAVGFLGPQSLEVGAATRTSELYVPDGYDGSQAYPIVLAFHGDGGTGAGIRASLGLEATSGGQALFVYPDGASRTWQIDTLAAMMPDIAFVDAVVDALRRTYCVDDTRIFATGMSRGAYFVNQLVCRSQTSFRAIASHSGGGPFGVADSEWDGQGNLLCPATVSALQVHGLADTVVPLSEGVKAREFWRAKNACGSATSPYGTSPCVSYAGCARPEVWCAVPGLGHARWASASRVTWDFFDALR
jgi:polyhydroxybutyrate depolymerase